MKQNVGAGRTTGVTAMSEQHLIIGAMVEGVGLLQALQDDIHHLLHVAGCPCIPRDLQDRGHAKVHQNLGHIPHQGRQLPALDDMVCLDVLMKPPELNKLHQLIVVDPRVESSGLRQCEHCTPPETPCNR
jgi:hypothetical protein